MPGRKQKAGEKGPAAQYMTRGQALKKLQLSLSAFRRLCILKNIFPRDPPTKQKKKTGGDKVYYHVKDVLAVQHEPLLGVFRQLHAAKKKITKALGRKEKAKAKRIIKGRPAVQLHGIVKERYPTLKDAVADMDDALCTIAIYAVLPVYRQRGVKAEQVLQAGQLLDEFLLLAAQQRALRSVFASIKGYYFRLQLLGQDVVFLLPHYFVQAVPETVDMRVLSTFFSLYSTTLRFVIFKFYLMAGLAYPPTVAASSCSSSLRDREGKKKQKQKQQQSQSLSSSPEEEEAAAEAAAEQSGAAKRSSSAAAEGTAKRTDAARTAAAAAAEREPWSGACWRFPLLRVHRIEGGQQQQQQRLPHEGRSSSRVAASVKKEEEETAAERGGGGEAAAEKRRNVRKEGQGDDALGGKKATKKDAETAAAAEEEEEETADEEESSADESDDKEQEDDEEGDAEEEEEEDEEEADEEEEEEEEEKDEEEEEEEEEEATAKIMKKKQQQEGESVGTAGGKKKKGEEQQQEEKEGEMHIEEDAAAGEDRKKEESNHFSDNSVKRRKKKKEMEQWKDEISPCGVHPHPVQRLFENLVFFLSREIPLLPFSFLIRSCGGSVGWQGSGSPFGARDPRITHHIVDRPLSCLQQQLQLQQEMQGRELVQPQWLLDSINAAVLLPVHAYAPGKTLPPHLSPFVDDYEEGYVPRQRKILDCLIAEKKSLGAATVPRGSSSGRIKEEDEENEERDEGDSGHLSPRPHEKAEQRFQRQLEAEAAGLLTEESEEEAAAEAEAEAEAAAKEERHAATTAEESTSAEESQQQQRRRLLRKGSSSRKRGGEAFSAAAVTSVEGHGQQQQQNRKRRLRPDGSAAEDEEQREAKKALLSKKHRRLLERIEHGARQKQQKAARLQAKRDALEAQQQQQQQK